jgi:hypothetical protein
MSYLRSVCAAVPRHITDDLGEVLCVVHYVDVSQHFEVRKVGRDGRHLEGGRSSQAPSLSSHNTP